MVGLLGCGSPAGSVAPGRATPAAVPASQTTGLAHFDADGLAFDYPAAWHVSPSGLNEHYVTVLDFLGTGSASAACVQITPGPSDSFISGTTCQRNVTLGPGQVVVELLRSDGPPRPGPIDPADHALLGDGDSFVTVGGLPAIAGQEAGHPWGSDLALTWTLSVPAELISRYQISAYIKGPGVEEMQAQAEALVASMAYDPPVPVLNPADGPRILGVGLAQAKASDPSFACFPTEPNATATATVTELPMYSALRKPLPVTCLTTIEPEQIGLWKVTLTESWTAAADRSAGRLVTTLWLAADGTPGQMGGGPGPSEIPYWQ
jgi:hypothetical protein